MKFISETAFHQHFNGLIRSLESRGVRITHCASVSSSHIHDQKWEFEVRVTLEGGPSSPWMYQLIAGRPNRRYETWIRAHDLPWTVRASFGLPRETSDIFASPHELANYTTRIVPVWVEQTRPQIVLYHNGITLSVDESASADEIRMAAQSLIDESKRRGIEDE